MKEFIETEFTLRKKLKAQEVEIKRLQSIVDFYKRGSSWDKSPDRMGGCIASNERFGREMGE